MAVSTDQPNVQNYIRHIWHVGEREVSFCLVVLRGKEMQEIGANKKKNPYLRKHWFTSWRTKGRVLSIIPSVNWSNTLESIQETLEVRPSDFGHADLEQRPDSISGSNHYPISFIEACGRVEKQLMPYSLPPTGKRRSPWTDLILRYTELVCCPGWCWLLIDWHHCKVY